MRREQTKAQLRKGCTSNEAMHPLKPTQSHIERICHGQFMAGLQEIQPVEEVKEMSGTGPRLLGWVHQCWQPAAKERTANVTLRRANARMWNCTGWSKEKAAEFEAICEAFPGPWT